MTTEPQKQDLYHLVKNGMYFRPDGAGYTASIKEAGIFSEDHALRYCRGCDEVEMHIVTDKLEAPADADQTATLQAMDILQQRIAFLEKALEKEKVTPSVGERLREVGLKIGRAGISLSQQASVPVWMETTEDNLPLDNEIVLMAWKNTIKPHIAVNSHLPDWDMEVGEYCTVNSGHRSFHGRATHYCRIEPPKLRAYNQFRDAQDMVVTNQFVEPNKLLKCDQCADLALALGLVIDQTAEPKNASHRLSAWIHGFVFSNAQKTLKEYRTNNKVES